MKLSIVVPCYNEAKNLPRLLGRFREVLADSTGVEVVLVDNGSTDDSPAVLTAELAAPEHAFARSVRVPVNKGYGHGILTGLRSARGEFLGWTHADLQTDPADVLDGFARMLTDPDPAQCLLRGRRVGRNWFDACFTAGMSLTASLALSCPLQDINAQPKVFHRTFFDRWAQPPDDFSLDLYVLYLARRSRLRLVEQPVHFGKRVAGDSKGGGSLRGKVRLTKRTLRYIFDLRRTLRTTPKISI